ncbi:sigma-70 family RNA polymerase sigma factor [Acidovorax sp. YS12]|nr:sigma-70 family RNA polymerase sigma factor [Acidovorax sp. YS12]
MPTTGIALQQSIESFYADHHGWLKAWLRRRLGNSFDAADLAHDTFLRLLRRDDLPAIREPRALLTTVAQGVVSNFHRHRRVEEAYLATLASLPEPTAPSPETRAILLETLVELDRRLDALDVPVRKAFLLSQLDGMKQADIAIELNLSLATVQRHIAKAARMCFFGLDV